MTHPTQPLACISLEEAERGGQRYRFSDGSSMLYPVGAQPRYFAADGGEFTSLSSRAAPMRKARLEWVTSMRGVKP